MASVSFLLFLETVTPLVNDDDDDTLRPLSVSLPYAEDPDDEGC